MNIDRLSELIARRAEVMIMTHRHFQRRSFLHMDHVHKDHYQIAYMVRGNSRPLVGRRILQMQDGDAMVFSPGQWHGPGPDVPAGSLKMLQLKFRLPGRKYWQPRGVIQVDSRLGFESVFRDMLSEFHMRRPLREQVLRSHLLQLVIILQRSRMQKTANSARSRVPDRLRVRDERKVRQVMDWMTLHYREALSLPAVAAAAGMSVSALSHAFKTMTGISPMRYLADFRLTQALALMQQTDQKLDTIAAAAGFSSSNYLSRVFKKRLQQTPRRYTRR